MNPESAPPSVEAQLAVINVKLDTILASRDDHETRIRSLERFQWRQVGAAGGIATLISGLALALMRTFGG